MTHATDAQGFPIVKRGRGQPRKPSGQKEGGVKVGLWLEAEIVEALDALLKPGETRTVAIREAITEMVYNRKFEVRV